VGAGAEPVDVRADRAVQGTVAVATLAGFVFHQPWVIPVLGVLLGLGALFVPAGNAIYRLFVGLVLPRLRSAAETEPAGSLHAQDVLGFALLAVGTGCIAIGLGGIAWFVALLEAGVAVTAATTGLHLGVLVRDRLRRRH